MAYAEKRGKYWRGRYKLPNGRYGSVSEDENGQPFTTKKTAKQAAQDLEVDVRRQTFVNPRDGKIKLSAWAEIWLASIEVGPLSERDYRSRLAAVILPHWGNVAVGDITAVAYATWEKGLRKEGRAENSIRGIRSVFRTMMEDARLSKLRGDNPIPNLKGSRRGKHKPKKRREEEKPFASPRQVYLVAQNALAVRGPSIRALVLTAAYTGMRIGELAGLERARLKLDDRDGTGCRILLEFQSQYVDGSPTLIPAKYDSGRGLIIPPFLADELRTLTDSHGNDFVFTAPKGGRLLINGDFYDQTWEPCVSGRPPLPSSRGHAARPGVRPVLGVEGMVPHGLRHSHKVWLDEAGHPRVAVEERMGHELPGVEGTYSHTTLAMELKIAETLQTLWEESTRPVIDRRELGPLPSPASSHRS